MRFLSLILCSILFCNLPANAQDVDLFDSDYRIIVLIDPSDELRAPNNYANLNSKLQKATDEVIAGIIETLLTSGFNDSGKSNLATSANFVAKINKQAAKALEGLIEVGSLNLSIFYIPWSPKMTWMTDWSMHFNGTPTAEGPYAQSPLAFPEIYEKIETAEKNVAVFSSVEAPYTTQGDFDYDFSTLLLFSMQDTEVKLPMAPTQTFRFKTVAVQAHLDSKNTFLQTQVAISLGALEMELDEKADSAHITSAVIPLRDTRTVQDMIDYNELSEPTALIQLEAVKYGKDADIDLSPLLVSFGPSPIISSKASWDYFGESFGMSLSVDEVSGCGVPFGSESGKNKSVPYLRGQALESSLLNFDLKLFNIILDFNPKATSISDSLNISYVDAGINLDNFLPNTCISLGSVNKTLAEKFDGKLDNTIQEQLEKAGLGNLSIGPDAILDLVTQFMGAGEE